MFCIKCYKLNTFQKLHSISPSGSTHQNTPYKHFLFNIFYTHLGICNKSCCSSKKCQYTQCISYYQVESIVSSLIQSYNSHNFPMPKHIDLDRQYMNHWRIICWKHTFFQMTENNQQSIVYIVDSLYYHIYNNPLDMDLHNCPHPICNQAYTLNKLSNLSIVHI